MGFFGGPGLALMDDYLVFFAHDETVLCISQVHLDRDIGVHPDLLYGGAGEGADRELGRRVGAVAGQGESREDGAGEDDVLGGGTGLSGRALLFSLSGEKPGTHDGLGHFGGTPVVDIHFNILFGEQMHRISYHTGDVTTCCCSEQP